jgi:hypothetical protein
MEEDKGNVIDPDTPNPTAGKESKSLHTFDYP